VRAERSRTPVQAGWRTWAIWQGRDSRTPASSAKGRSPEPESLLVRAGDRTRRLTWRAGEGISLADYTAPPSKAPDLSRIQVAAGLAVQPPLAADLDGDGRNEIIQTAAGKTSVYAYEAGKGLV